MDRPQRLMRAWTQANLGTVRIRTPWTRKSFGTRARETPRLSPRGLLRSDRADGSAGDGQLCCKGTRSELREGEAFRVALLAESTTLLNEVSLHRAGQCDGM